MENTFPTGKNVVDQFTISTGSVTITGNAGTLTISAEDTAGNHNVEVMVSGEPPSIYIDGGGGIIISASRVTITKICNVLNLSLG